MRIHIARLRDLLIVLGLAAVVGIVIAAIAWSRPPRTLLTVSEVQALLPPGSELHSLARLQLDGRPPPAVAVVAAIPRHPGAHAMTYQSFVFTYDRWRRRFRRAYSQPLPGPLPLSVDAGTLLGSRDAAIFAALQEDGTRSYRVVGSLLGTVSVIQEGWVAGNLVVADPLLIEDGDRRRALAWDGQRFSERPLPASLPPAYRGITWHYTVRKGAVVARTSSVQLHPRQPLRVDGGTGGPIAIVIPDARLDIAEAGYRARTPGLYTIRILIPFAPLDQAYQLKVLVTPDTSTP